MEKADTSFVFECKEFQKVGWFGEKYLHIESVSVNFDDFARVQIDSVWAVGT